MEAIGFVRERTASLWLDLLPRLLLPLLLLLLQLQLQLQPQLRHQLPFAPSPCPPSTGFCVRWTPDRDTSRLLPHSTNFFPNYRASSSSSFSTFASSWSRHVRGKSTGASDHLRFNASKETSSVGYESRALKAITRGQICGRYVALSSLFGC